MAVGEDKGENIRKAIKLVNDAKSKGSSLVVLPECFNCPYGTSKLNYFSEYVITNVINMLLDFSKIIRAYCFCVFNMSETKIILPVGCR